MISPKSSAHMKYLADLLLLAELTSVLCGRKSQNLKSLDHFWHLPTLWGDLSRRPRHGFTALLFWFETGRRPSGREREPTLVSNFVQSPLFQQKSSIGPPPEELTVQCTEGRVQKNKTYVCNLSFWIGKTRSLLQEDRCTLRNVY